MSEFDKDQFDRYIKASKMLDEAANLLADAETGYWGHWIPFRDAVRMLVRGRSSGVLDLIAMTGNSIIDAAERKRKKGPPRRRRAA